tara:strand:- start:2125 stop:2745 length:621 start_codon:yes stop_codon:yes gene_type:complete
MGLISNGTTLLDGGSLDGGVSKGALTLIKTLTASSDSTLSFVDGASSVVLDDTYVEYIFKFINMHPSGDSSPNDFTVNFRDGGSAYDATKTTTFFWAYHNEDDSGTQFGSAGSNDSAEATGTQPLSGNCGNDNDQCVSGTLHLFDPSNTTFAKHFMTVSNSTEAGDISMNSRVAGYCNVTAAIDGVQFAFQAGNIDSGTIKLYGVA